MVQDFFLLSLRTYEVSFACGFPHAWQLFAVTAMLFVGTLTCLLPGCHFSWKLRGLRRR